MSKKHYVTSGFYSDIDDIDNVTRADSETMTHPYESQNLRFEFDVSEKSIPLKIDLDALGSRISYIIIKSSRLTRFQKWCLKHSGIVKLSK